MKLSKKIKDSLELKFSILARKKNNKGQKLISLGLGEPDFPTPKIIIDKTYEAIKKGYTKYSDPRGLKILRKKIAEYLNSKFKSNVNYSEIIITSGAKMGMFLALSSILEPNDEVINFTPNYPSYEPQILIAEPTAKIKNSSHFTSRF